MKEAYQNQIIELKKRIAELEEKHNEMLQLSELEKNPKIKKEKLRKAKQHPSYFILNLLKGQLEISQKLLKRELSNEVYTAKERNKEKLEKINEDLKSFAIHSNSPKINNTQMEESDNSSIAWYNYSIWQKFLFIFTAAIVLLAVLYFLYLFLVTPFEVNYRIR
jgi:hypothetical protein